MDKHILQLAVINGHIDEAIRDGYSTFITLHALNVMKRRYEELHTERDYYKRLAEENTEEEEDGSEKFVGVVKWFNSEKGYGFIETDIEDCIFAHYTRINTDGFKTLDDGEKVEFEIRDERRGKEAFNIVREREIVSTK